MDDRLKRAQDDLASALRNIYRSEVNELSSLRNPHNYLIRLFEAICILFQEKKPSLQIGQKLTRNAAFVNNLYNYDKDGMPPSTLKRLKKYVEDPRFQPEYFQDYKPAAAMATFIISLVKYVEISRACAGLFEACNRGNIERVKDLLSKDDVDVNEIGFNGESCLLTSLRRGYFEIAQLLILKNADVRGEECIAEVILKAQKDLFLLFVEKGVDLGLKRSDGKTLHDIAKESGELPIMELLIQVHPDSMIQHIEGLGNDEECHLFFTNRDFTYDSLTAACHSLWLYLVQLQSPLLERWVTPLIQQMVASYPQLVHAQDSKHRSALDLASAANKLAMKSAFLWHGRYRITETRPDHISATCYVYRALDEAEKDDAGNPPRVCLKFMRFKAHYQRELVAREMNLDADFVVAVIHHYPPIGQLSQWPEDAFQMKPQDAAGTTPEPGSAVLEEQTNLTKSTAEKMFMIVMPLADRNMFVSLKQERYAGRNMEEVRHVFAQLVRCVEHLHINGLLHGDVKPLNIVRMGTRWKLIDLDATCRIGKDNVGFKSSSAYVPPETFQIIEHGSRGKRAVLKSCANQEKFRDQCEVDLLLAESSFDIWSLGCILYQLCHPDVLPLFQEAGQDDNISEELDDGAALSKLALWTEETKTAKVSHIKDRLARNLISQLLSKDPSKRPPLSRILNHPFITGKASVRMIGEVAKYDVFLSYRVQSDSHHASTLYRLLTDRFGLKVFLDKECLEPGKNWKEGFCAGLVSSRVFICLLSKEALNSPTNPKQNLSYLSTDSPCDNVFLEHRFALELKQLGLIETVFPILIGDVISDRAVTSVDLADVAFLYGNYFQDKCVPNFPDISVHSVELDLSRHMESQGLGSPVSPDRTVASVYKDILEIQGFLLEGDGQEKFVEAAGVINDLVCAVQQKNSLLADPAIQRSGSLKDKLAASLRTENEIFRATIIQQEEELRKLREIIAQAAKN